MTHHWSSQPRHQSTNHTTLTDLEDSQSFTNLHQATIPRVPLLNFTVRSSMVATFCPDYCHQLCLEIFKQNLQLFSFIHQHAVTCKYQVYYITHWVQSTSLPSTTVISSKETLRFQGVERKVPPAAPWEWWSQRRIIQSQQFLLGFGNKEPMNLLVETSRNNKTIMLSCVIATRINRIQFSESVAKRKWIWRVLGGRHTNLSQFPAWQLPVRNCTWSAGSSCMPYYLSCKMPIHTTFPTLPFATRIMNEPSSRQARSWSP